MCRAMRIAYLVDVHGRFDAVARAMGAIGDDLLVIAGDITRRRQLAPRLLAPAATWIRRRSTRASPTSA
jgi:Icc-related predicted phosphoesterase